MSGQRETDGFACRSPAAGPPGAARSVWLYRAALAALLSLVATFAIREIREPDFFYHLAVGELVVSGTLDLDREPFAQEPSSVRPGAWHVHEWLYQAWMVQLVQAGGPPLLLLWSAGLLLGTWWLLAGTLRAQGTGPALTVALTLLAALVGRERWSTRPELATYLLAALTMRLAARPQALKSRLTWLALPLVFALWANLHGGFVVGLVWLACWGLDRVREDGCGVGRPAALLGLCVAATGANPHGHAILTYPVQLLEESYILSTIFEWMSPSFDVELALEAYLLLGIAVFWLSREAIRAGELLFYLGALHLVLGDVRHLVLFALMTAPIVARHAGAIWASHRETAVALRLRRAGMALAPMAVVSLAVWASLRFPAPCRVLAERPIETRIFPVEACEFLARARPPGPLLNRFDWAGYVLARLPGLYRVFIDGRLEVYTEAHHRDYNLIVNHQPGWAEMLDRHGLNLILLPSDCNLARALLVHEKWALLHADSVAVVFLRNVPAHREWIARHGKKGKVAYQ